MNIKNKYFLSLLASVLFCAGARNSAAMQTWLALHSGSVMPICGGFTGLTLTTNFGTQLIGRPLSGTSAFDFYSPPLRTAVTLTTSEKAGGSIFLQNIGTNSATDFSVTGRMQYFDYDPKTGINTPLADTGASSPTSVNYGQKVRLDVSNAKFSSNITVPAGHMIHLSMTIAPVSGNPGGTGQVLFNGPMDQSTAAMFPQDHSIVIDWGFDPCLIYGSQPMIVCLTPQPGGSMCVSCAGKAATTYSIQATASLQSPAWTTLVTTNSDNNGLYSFIHQGAASYHCCFYRTVTTAP